MALELLAGPFTLTSTEGNNPRMDGEEQNYIDELGFISNLSIYNSGVLIKTVLAVIELDGQCFARGHARNAINSLIGVDGHKGLLYQSGGIFPLNPFQNALGTSYGALTVTTRMVHLPKENRFLRVVRDIVSRRVETSNNGTTWTTETILTSTGQYFSTPSLTLCKDGRLAIGWNNNGVISTYDTIAKVQSDVDRFIPFTHAGGLRGIFYSLKHNVYLSLHNAGSNVYQTRVWASTPAPSALSNPVATPSPVKGGVSVMQVRLTGSNGEACVDELIDWSLTGTGALSVIQSKTDTNGYAEVDYIAPITSLPTFTVNASVTY